jgi:hypothetical protein
MGNALARQETHAQAEAFPPGADEAALRLALQDARELATQSRLLALNVAFEAAGAGVEAQEDAGALAATAGHALAEAEKLAGAVDLLLQQIQSAAALSRPL